MERSLTQLDAAVEGALAISGDPKHVYKALTREYPLASQVFGLTGGREDQADPIEERVEALRGLVGTAYAIAFEHNVRIGAGNETPLFENDDDDLEAMIRESGILETDFDPDTIDLARLPQGETEDSSNFENPELFENLSSINVNMQRIGTGEIDSEVEMVFAYSAISRGLMRAAEILGCHVLEIGDVIFSDESLANDLEQYMALFEQYAISRESTQLHIRLLTLEAVFIAFGYEKGKQDYFASNI